MSKLRILLADDEPQVRAFVRVFLLAAQFEVVESNDGVEALEALDRADSPFDLLISDIKMPRMDGIALARSVAQTCPRLPVLFISGYSGMPDSRKCACIARWEFLEKPFTPKVLLQKIAALLDNEARASVAAG